MSLTIKGFRNKFIKLKEAIESKCLKVNLKKTKVMVSSVITNDGLSKSKVDPCGDCSLRAKVNSVLCVQCGVDPPYICQNKKEYLRGVE